MPAKSATRRSVAAALADGLRAQGYAHVTDAHVGEIIAAWLGGARGLNLPHGIVGALVGRHLDALEAEQPGVLRGLR